MCRRLRELRSLLEVDDDLPPGTMLRRGKYRIETAICSGGFGIVYRARDKNGAIFAIKEFFVDGFSIRGDDGPVFSPPDYADEIQELMLLLSHPNVLRVLGYFEENNTGYIVLEYIAGADLQDIMEHHPDWLEPRQIVQIASILCDGLQYLHLNGVVHGDIAPDNVIMRGSTDPVLIDFGSSLYHMVVGDAPDGGKLGVEKRVLESELARYIDDYDRHFLSTISSALSVHREERPTAAEIAQVCRSLLVKPDSSAGSFQ